VEKEEVVMRRQSIFFTEAKISFPIYKVIYSVFFTVILSIIRGVSFTNEIGGTLEPQMGILAAVFCADIYVQEVASGRWEINRLYPMKNRMGGIWRRMAVQETYLFLLGLAGYGLIYLLQNPIPYWQGEWGKEILLFLIYIPAMAGTIIFWGMLSNVVACIFRNMWAGAGISLVLWIAVNSTYGDRIMGIWNPFSYTFRDIEDIGNLSWILGKILWLFGTILLGVVLKRLIKKRG